MPDSRDARTVLPIPDAPPTGSITLAIAEAADIADHIVDPQEVVRVAMARQ